MSLDFVVSCLLPWLGLLIGAGLGLAALAAPERMLSFVGLAAAAPEGLAEARATYGGLFLALELGAAVLWLARSSTDGLAVAGIAWTGAAAGRVFSLAVDGRRTARNGQAVAFELFIGLAHIAALLRSTC
jgi:uncharacterized protein YfiM (DUF2279 family)